MYAQMSLIWVNCICRRNFSFQNQLRNGPGLRWAYMLVLLPQSSDPTRPTTAPNIGFWFLNVDLWVHHMHVYQRVNTDIGPRKHLKKFRNLDLWQKKYKNDGKLEKSYMERECSNNKLIILVIIRLFFHPFNTTVTKYYNSYVCECYHSLATCYELPNNLFLQLVELHGTQGKWAVLGKWKVLISNEWKTFGRIKKNSKRKKLCF